LRQEAEPRTGAVVDLDPSDPAVGVGIEFDGDIVGVVGGGALRHFDEAGGAANAEGCGRRRDLHVAGFCDRRRDKGHGALGDVERAGILLAAVFIHERVDGDLRVGF